MAEALRRVRGVVSVAIDSQRDEALVVRQRGRAADAHLVGAVHAIGYEASVIPMAMATLAVEGMGCQGCPERVRQALGAVPGVRGVTVDGPRRARVLYDRRHATERTLVQAVRRAGFPAKTAR